MSHLQSATYNNPLGTVATLSPPYQQKLKQLNQASINKFYLPYQDIDWDAEEHQIDANDDIWGQIDDTFMANTDWYHQLPQHTRNQYGLQTTVNTTRLGIVFENILTQGLLAFAKQLPTGSPEYRYAMHEAIEECHHSMMFQEFINRSGMVPDQEDWLTRYFGFSVGLLGAYFPEMFFIFVLGGEAPIDYAQRESLRSELELHPLLKKIMQIHTTEEARHINFAEHYLAEHVPQLSAFKKFRLSTATPIILTIMANTMMKPSKATIKQFNIPKEAILQAYDQNAEYNAFINEAFADVVALCGKLGLINSYSKPLWKKFAI